MQSAFDLLTPSTLYTIIKSNNTKLLERRTAMFYLALVEKTPRRCIAADIAMRKHGVAHAQTKCPSAIQTRMESKKQKLSIFDQMAHRQTNSSRQKLKKKLQTVPRGKANDYERWCKKTFSIDALNCLVNVVKHNTIVLDVTFV